MIYPVRDHELPALIELYIKVFNAPPWNESHDSVSTRNRFNSIFARPDAVCRRIMRGHKLAGYYIGHIEPSEDGYELMLKEVLVAPDLQYDETTRKGQGIGRKLMADAEIYARNNKCSKITLSTSTGVGAYEFYRKLGYEALAASVEMEKAVSEVTYTATPTHIQPIASDDLPGLAQLHVNAFASREWKELRHNQETSMARLSYLHQMPGALAIKYVRERQPIAYLFAYPESFSGVKELIIKEVVVAPEWQHRGIGKELMQAAEAYAGSNNFTKIGLGTSKIGRARDFCKGLGYDARESSIVMEKPVARYSSVGSHSMIVH